MCLRWLEGIVQMTTCYLLGLHACDSPVTGMLSQSFTLSSLFLCALHVGCSQSVLLSFTLCQGSPVHSHTQT